MSLTSVAVILCGFLCLAVAHLSDSFTTLSGKKIPFHLIRKQLPSIAEKDFKHHVYEYHNDVLQCHSSSLDISSIGQKSRIHGADSPLKVTINGRVRNDFTRSMDIRKGRGYTLLFSGNGETLISAWGPRLRLQPLDMEKYPNILINKYGKFGSTYPDIAKFEDSHLLKDFDQTIDDTRPDEAYIGVDQIKSGENVKDALLTENNFDLYSEEGFGAVKTSGRQTSSGTCAEGTPHYVQIAAAFDNSWCANYGNDPQAAIAVIQTLINDANDAYVAKTCARLALTHVEAHCNDNADPYGLPAAARDCSIGSQKCSRASIILDMFRSFWVNNREYVKRDVALFFPGYEDGTEVTGSALTGAACVSNSAYAWIEGPWSIIVAHEVGHLLGAEHDSSGFMISRLTVTDSPVMSDRTANTIVTFIDGKSDPSCLPTSNPKLQWSPTIQVPGLFSKSNNGGGISFGELSGDKTKDLFMMHIDDSKRSNDVYYRVARNVQRSSNGLYTIKDFLGPYKVPGSIGDSGGGDIAVGNIRSPTSKDIVVFHIESSKKVNQGYYRIGFGANSNGIVGNGNWGEKRGIPGFWGQKTQAGGIALASFRDPTQIDLLVVHTDNPRGDNNAYYRIGFNLDSDGIPQQRWGPIIKIPGSFGTETGGIGVAVYDTNENGKNDMVIYYVENLSNGSIGYYMIGYDIDSDGIVSSWSPPKRVDEWYGDNTQGTGFAITDLGDGQPTSAAFHIDNPKGANRGYIRFRRGGFSGDTV